MPMRSFAVIESYLDGCTFNEVGCGGRSPRAGRKGMDERDAAGGKEEGRKGPRDGTGAPLKGAHPGPIKA